MTTPGKEPTVVVSKELEDPIARVLARWDETIKTSAELGKRNRRLLRWVMVSLLVDVLFTAFIAIGGYQLHQTSVTANELRQSTYQSCLTSNTDRIIVLNLWEEALGHRSGPTAETQALINEAKQAYAQRLCVR